MILIRPESERWWIMSIKLAGVARRYEVQLERQPRAVPMPLPG